MLTWFLANWQVVLQWITLGLLFIAWLQRRHQVVTSQWGWQWAGGYRFDGVGQQPEQIDTHTWAVRHWEDITMLVIEDVLAGFLPATTVLSNDAAKDAIPIQDQFIDDEANELNIMLDTRGLGRDEEITVVIDDGLAAITEIKIVRRD